MHARATQRRACVPPNTGHSAFPLLLDGRSRRLAMGVATVPGTRMMRTSRCPPLIRDDAVELVPFPGRCGRSAPFGRQPGMQCVAVADVLGRPTRNGGREPGRRGAFGQGRRSTFFLAHALHLRASCCAGVGHPMVMPQGLDYVKLRGDIPFSFRQNRHFRGILATHAPPPPPARLLPDQAAACARVQRTRSSTPFRLKAALFPGALAGAVGGT